MNDQLSSTKSATISRGLGMSGEWPIVRLGDVASVRSGYAFKSGDWTETGVPVVKIANVKGGRLEMSGCSYVSPSVAEACGEFQLNEDDILIAMTGYIGDVAKVRYGDLPCVLNQRVGKFTINDSHLLNKDYLFAYLSWQETRTTIESLGYGSAQPNVSPGLIHSVTIPLPPLPEQRRIAKILGDLDDKIELNRKMNETLEQMARALFKSWFIDFDPVRAKMDGRMPEGMDADTAALFPSRLVESELGLVPEGWEVKSLAEVSTVGIGKTPPRKEHHWFSENPEDVPWMSIRDLGDAGVFIAHTTEFLTAEAVEKFRVRRIPDNTVVLSFKLTMGRVAITDGEMLSNEAIAHFRINPETPFGSEYLYCYLKGFGFDQLGSTSSIATAINSDMVRGIKVLVPTVGVSDSFEKKFEPLFAQIKNMSNQSRTLASLRDTLLPKLMRGEVV